ADDDVDVGVGLQHGVHDFEPVLGGLGGSELVDGDVDVVSCGGDDVADGLVAGSDAFAVVEVEHQDAGVAVEVGVDVVDHGFGGGLAACVLVGEHLNGAGAEGDGEYRYSGFHGFQDCRAL